MKIVFSGLVSHMTGSFGGASIRKYKQGFSMYPKVVEAKRNTSNQSMTRARYARICSAWNALLEAEIAEWDFRRIQAGYIDISTFNFYVLVQTQQMQAFNSVVDISYYDPVKPVIDYFNYSISSGNIIFICQVYYHKQINSFNLYVSEISKGTTSVFFDRLPLLSQAETDYEEETMSFVINNSIFKTGGRYATRAVWVGKDAIKSEPVDLIIQL